MKIKICDIHQRPAMPNVLFGKVIDIESGEVLMAASIAYIEQAIRNRNWTVACITSLPHEPENKR